MREQRAAAPGNDNSKVRSLNGCQDTDNNSADFTTLTPALARNSSTTPVTCSGGGTTLFGALAANPTSGNPGSTTLLVMTVIPATTPPSTGITVSGNLTQIGGSAAQNFFDDGTNGDVTPGDNKFSYLATVDKRLRPHDLRRTFRTMLSRLGIPPHIAELCLPHQEAQTMRRVYDGHDYSSEMASAWDTAGAHVEALRNGAAPVIPIMARRA